MAGKPASDTSPRSTAKVQVCLTPTEKAVLTAYAEANHGGKLSIAARALLLPKLQSALPSLV